LRNRTSSVSVLVGVAWLLQVLDGITAVQMMMAHGIGAELNPLIQTMFLHSGIVGVAAVKAADLVATLKGPGPFTVFAPTNEAFSKLPAGTVDTLLKPESKDTLTKVLTYHVVAGKVTAADLKKMIKAGNGTASLKTVSGGTLTAMIQGANVVLKDEKGGTSMVTIADVNQSNGVIHVIDTVVMPE